ncbi:MAG TPA: DMT family transporter [Deltaproteobacteria bacterium]|nr:DMT family transporter [Deltaproteobacteria bacterium]
MRNDPFRGVAWAFASAFAIAAFVIPWKLAALHGDARVNTLVLLASAATFTTLLTVVRQKALPRFRAFDLRVAAALAFFTLLGNLASASAIQLVSPALLTVVQRSEVIFVALLAWPIIGERIDGLFWLGAALALAGLVLLQDPLDLGEPRAVGMAWAVASAACFGSMAVITRRSIHRIELVSVNALRLWLSVAFWFALNGLPEALREISLAQVGYAALAAFFGPFLGRLCIMTSARYIQARITTLVTLAAPPLTLGLAYLLLSDLPTVREIQGGALMLVGIAIPIAGGTWASTRRAPPSVFLEPRPDDDQRR